MHRNSEVQAELKNTKSLIADIKKSGYSYFPVYGGYKGTDGMVDKYEPSFFHY